MGTRGRCFHLIAVAAVAALPTAALAAPSNVDISRAIYARFSPERVGKHSHVIFTADLTKDPNRGGRTPRSITFRFARGFNINRGAVQSRCSSGQARAHSCPAQSQIGSASFVTAVKQGAQRVVGQVKLYLGAAQHATSGTVKADVRSAGHRRSTTGQIVRINDPVYAYELRVDGLRSAAGGAVQRIHANIGASSLITNPRICPGGWHYGVAVTYTDGVRHRGDGSASCKER